MAIWAVALQRTPSPQGPGFWQRSRRGNSEWCNSARGPNTLFPLWCGLCARRRGAIALIGSSSWTRSRPRPRLTPCCASADAVPTASPWGGTWNGLKVFGYHNRFGNKSAESRRRLCRDYVLDICLPDDWCNGICCKPECKKKKSFLLSSSFFFHLTALFKTMVTGKCSSFVLLH